MRLWGHKSTDEELSGFLFPEVFERGGCEALPFGFNLDGIGRAGVDQESVAESEGGAGLNHMRVAECCGGTHPTIVSHVEFNGVMDVFRVIHEGDSLVGDCGDGSRVIHPAGGLAEALLFVETAFGVSDASASVVDAHRFRHPDSKEPERCRSDGNGFF